MRLFFILLIILHFGTYFLPFGEGMLGYELEWDIWNAMLNGGIPDHYRATVVSFRWLTNLLILTLCWLRMTEIRHWILWYTDAWLLDRLLCGVLCFFVAYPFFFESFMWEWGGLLWAISAILIAIYSLLLKNPILREPDHELEQHFVDLKELPEL